MLAIGININTKMSTSNVPPAPVSLAIVSFRDAFCRKDLSVTEVKRIEKIFIDLVESSDWESLYRNMALSHIATEAQSLANRGTSRLVCAAFTERKLRMRR